MTKEDLNIDEKLTAINNEIRDLEYTFKAKMQDFDLELHRENLKLNSGAYSLSKYLLFAFIIYLMPFIASVIIAIKEIPNYKKSKLSIAKAILICIVINFANSIAWKITVFLAVIKFLQNQTFGKKNEEILKTIDQLTTEKNEFSTNSECAIQLTNLKEQKKRIEEETKQKELAEQDLKRKQQEEREKLVEEMSKKFRMEREVERQNDIKKKQEKIRADYEQKQSNLQTVTPLIVEFVNKTIDNNQKFPHISSLTEQYVNGLQQYLLNETGIEIEIERIRTIANNELESKCLNIFEASFIELNPQLPSDKISDWIKAYVNTFELSKKYLYELEMLLSRKNIPFAFDDTIKDYIKTAVQEELIRNTQEKDETIVQKMAQDWLTNIYNRTTPFWKQFVVTALMEKEIDERKKALLAEKISNIMKGNAELSNAPAYNIDDIDQMDGVEFEQFLVKLFSSMKYKVSITQASRDQGADLIIENFTGKTIVQAKRYTGNVSNSAVQEAVAAISHYDCNNAMVVTNSYFTESAKELAKSNNVELWDRENLCKILDFYRIVLD